MAQKLHNPGCTFPGRAAFILFTIHAQSKYLISASLGG
jgi:hypothetical protein